MNSCRAAYNAAASASGAAGGGKGGVALDAFRSSAPAASLALPPDTLTAVWNAADVDGNHMIDLKARGARKRGGGKRARGSTARARAHARPHVGTRRLGATL